MSDEPKALIWFVVDSEERLTLATHDETEARNAKCVGDTSWHKILHPNGYAIWQMVT